MRHAAVAAMVALAGAGFSVPTGANAAAFSSAAGTRIDTAGSMIVQVQAPPRPVRRATPTARRPAPVVRRPATVVHRPTTVVRRPVTVVRRPTTVVHRPVRVVRPVVHVRGYRPPGFVRWHPRHLIVRPWYRRPWYGTVIGGVVLGTIVAATAYYAYASAPPAPGLCWFWADPDETQGYWDYCVDP